MDPGWEEVERMAQAALSNTKTTDKYPEPETIARWKRLFGYSHVEAVNLISCQRGDVARERIPDDHWGLIKDEKEAAGYDREAYEHSLQLKDVFKDQSATIPTTGERGEHVWLFRLGGLLDTPEKVKEIARLDDVPKTVSGLSEMGLARFCYVDMEAQKKLEQWLTQQSVLPR